MTGTGRSSEGLDARRRKLLIRSWRRGMREIDLILGAFADAEIENLTEAEIDQYETLLDIPDTDLLSWLTGQKPVPDAVRSDIFQKIVARQTERTET